ncbi:MAG: exodeoxyribonuclease III [Erysipelotrichales bacterium]|nr:exodeoxyribonuclease III [Erysipelotrichales bacterium]
MKFISWNVNGLRACVGKGFEAFFKQEDADFFCIQETKMQEGQLDLKFDGYYSYFNYAEKKGYSGTAIYTKHQPINVVLGINGEYNDEGRAITLEYDDFYLVNLYVPNSQEKLARLSYRMEFEDKLRTYVNELRLNKMVIICGDMNVAKEEIDIKNPKTNHLNAGFSDEERQKMRDLQASGFTDSYRYLYPDKADMYTWWSYRFKSRERNTGWRIDYFLVDTEHEKMIKEALIYTDVMGSDHCPIGLVL